MTLALVDWTPVPHLDVTSGLTYAELAVTALVYVVLLAVVGALVRPGAGGEFRQGFTASYRKHQPRQDEQP
jgi:hypothetical protein